MLPTLFEFKSIAITDSCLLPVALPLFSPFERFIMRGVDFWRKTILGLGLSHIVSEYVAPKSLTKPWVVLA